MPTIKAYDTNTGELLDTFEGIAEDSYDLEQKVIKRPAGSGMTLIQYGDDVILELVDEDIAEEQEG